MRSWILEPDQARIERERNFWDARTRETVDGHDHVDVRVHAHDRFDKTVPWLPYVGLPEQIDCLLHQLGDVEGKSVLDLGTGTGFMASLLAAKGAQVDAVDVSDESLAVAANRARLSGLADKTRFHNMSAESLDFPDESFDRVVGVFVLHHLDLARGAAEIHRVLRPGGVAVFIETWGSNKLLMAARRLLPGRFGIDKASSDDEAPLGQSARQILADSDFVMVKYLFPNLLFFRMLAYIPSARIAPIPRLLTAMDQALFKLPGLRRFSYYCVVTLKKADRPTPAG
jgi:ubiquinone/menaquinone biosynthesis C-methylase UbiE